MANHSRHLQLLIVTLLDLQRAGPRRSNFIYMLHINCLLFSGFSAQDVLRCWYTHLGRLVSCDNEHHDCMIMLVHLLLNKFYVYFRWMYTRDTTPYILGVVVRYCTRGRPTLLMAQAVLRSTSAQKKHCTPFGKGKHGPPTYIPGFSFPLTHNVNAVSHTTLYSVISLGKPFPPLNLTSSTHKTISSVSIRKLTHKLLR